MLRPAFVSAIVALGFVAAGSAAQKPDFTRAYALQPAEGVFAYSRISPDGNFLAYASLTYDTNRPRQQSAENLYAAPGTATNMGTVTVVDLKTGKVLFTERGIDAYWSLDGERIIYLGQGVSIWHRTTGEVVRNVAPGELGDYYSWAVRDGKNLILTISSNYYYLDGDKGVMPHGRVPACPGIGPGDRPLISKDGLRITTFVRGNIVVRNLTDCEQVFDTGIAGQKADFSYDNRYLAFHAQRPGTRHYDIMVVDLKERTVRNVTSSLSGSSLFPNFTRDGRLSFRYDSPEYRGFMFASQVLSVPASPLPKSTAALPAERSWSDIFPDSAAADRRVHDGAGLEQLECAFSRRARGHAARPRLLPPGAFRSGRARERGAGVAGRGRESAAVARRHHPAGDSYDTGRPGDDRGPQPDADDPAVPRRPADRQTAGRADVRRTAGVGDIGRRQAGCRLR